MTLPSVGRIVHYYLTEEEGKMFGRFTDVPMAAIVTAFDQHAFISNITVFIPGIPTPYCKSMTGACTEKPTAGCFTWPPRGGFHEMPNLRTP